MGFRIGQLLCLTCDIYEDGEDLPPGYLAYKGDIVEVVSLCFTGGSLQWDLSVCHPGRSGSFGVRETEVLAKGIKR